MPIFSRFLKMPVDSTTTSTPRVPHGRFAGSRSAITLNLFPLTTRKSPSTIIVPGNFPCTESYFSKCASVFASVRSLIATTSTFCLVSRARYVSRPILPNPLIPTLILPIHINFYSVLIEILKEDVKLQIYPFAGKYSAFF